MDAYSNYDVRITIQKIMHHIASKEIDTKQNVILDASKLGYGSISAYSFFQLVKLLQQKSDNVPLSILNSPKDQYIMASQS